MLIGFVRSLSLANLLAIGVFFAALPASCVALDQWRSLRKKEQADVEALTAAKTQAAATVAIAVKDPASPKIDVKVVPTSIPVVARTIVVQPKTDARMIEAGRPHITLSVWSVRKAALGQRTEWLITMKNSGRPTDVSVTDFQEVSNRDSPAVTPSCEDTRNYGGSAPIAETMSAIYTAATPLDQASWDAYNRGVPLMLSATFCYADELTKKAYTAHICVRGYVDGSVTACPKGNDSH